MRHKRTFLPSDSSSIHLYIRNQPESGRARTNNVERVYKLFMNNIILNLRLFSSFHIWLFPLFEFRVETVTYWLHVFFAKGKKLRSYRIANDFRLKVFCVRHDKRIMKNIRRRKFELLRIGKSVSTHVLELATLLRWQANSRKLNLRWKTISWFTQASWLNWARDEQWSEQI